MELKRTTEEESSGKYWDRKQKQLWVGTLFCGCAVVYAARTSMPLCALRISTEFGWDKKQSGSILSAFYWGYTMTQVVGGYMSDRIGGDKVLVVSGAAWSLLTFWTPWLVYLYPSKHSLLSMVVFSRVLMGCFQGVIFPSVSSLLGAHIEETKRALAFTCFNSGRFAGTIVSGSLGSILLVRYGWPVVFYLTGLLGMAWVLFLRYYLMAKHDKKAKILSVNEPTTSDKVSEPVPWMDLFRQCAFWAMVFAHFCHTWAFHLILSWLPTYFGENYPEAKGWVFNVVPWLVTIPFCIFGGWIADRLVAKGLTVTLVRKLAATMSLGMLGLFVMLVGYSTSYHSALTLMSLSIACAGFHGAGILVNPQDIAPKYSGSVFGIMNMVGAIPGFVAVFIAGYELEMTKSWTVVFNQTAVVCCLGWIVYLLFGTGKKIV